MSKEIVLCATQRCGSTLIVEDMRNTGVLGNPEEWFVPWNPEKTDVNWGEALASVRKRATGDNGVLAIKVMANQLHNIENCLKTAIRPPPSHTFFRFHKVFENATWVKLSRRDVVAQAVSRLMSRQTGINHATAQAEDEHFAGNLMRGLTEDYNAKAQYRYDALMHEVTAITLENLAWTRFFENFGITPIELVYEEVAPDPGMPHLDILARAIGLEDPPPRKPRSMVKMGNARNQEWIRRFHLDAAAHNFKPTFDQ